MHSAGIVESASYNGSAARVAEKPALGPPDVDPEDFGTGLSSLDGVCV